MKKDSGEGKVTNHLVFKGNIVWNYISFVPSANSDMLSNQHGVHIVSANFNTSINHFPAESWAENVQCGSVADLVAEIEQQQILQQPSDAFPCEKNYNFKYQYPFNVASTEELQNISHFMRKQPVANDCQFHSNFLSSHPAYSSPQFQLPPVSRRPEFMSSDISEPYPLPGSSVPRSCQARISLVPNSAGGFKAIVKRKRKRTMFRTEQIEVLEAVFLKRPYITRNDRQVLAEELQISDSAVKVWFQNRRLRGKRENEQAFFTSDCPSYEESFYSPPNSEQLDYLESEINKKTDEFGYVRLDDKAMNEIANVIDTVLSNVDLNLPGTEVEATAECPERTYATSIYEPISPGTPESTDEEVPCWKPFAPDQSLQRLFDLHFC